MTVLLIGDPRLRRKAPPVKRVDPADAKRLHAELARFRKEHGFGRAIAAPQIGINRRFFAMNLGHGPLLVVNPRITWRSRATFTLWDDCMSFPWLLVKVRRHASISVRFTDGNGTVCILEKLGRAESELFQHEIDHLDGILAIDRALDRESIISRAAFEENPGHFRNLVN